MDHTQQINEMTVLINRAKRAGFKVFHYPEQRLAILRVPAPEPADVPAPTAEAKPAAPATADTLL